MHDQVHNVSEAASSMSGAVVAKSVVAGGVIGAGEIAKGGAVIVEPGWMLTYFIPVIDVNAVQLFQLIGGIYMALQAYKLCRDEFGGSIKRFFTKLFSLIFGNKTEISQATVKQKPSDRFVVSVANGKDKPPPRGDNSNS